MVAQRSRKTRTCTAGCEVRGPEGLQTLTNTAEVARQFEIVKFLTAVQATMKAQHPDVWARGEF